MAAAYSAFQVRKACVLLMNFCRDANKLFNDRAPWKSRKEDPAECAATLNACLMLIRAVAVLSGPIIPGTSGKMKRLFQDPGAVRWDSLESPLSPGEPVNTLDILFTKIEDAAIAAYKTRLATCPA
jgi:methionyl-tRNA synthetase